MNKLTLLKNIAKRHYNPQQKRDWRGRWTLQDGGGGGDRVHKQVTVILANKKEVSILHPVTKKAIDNRAPGWMDLIKNRKKKGKIGLTEEELQAFVKGERPPTGKTPSPTPTTPAKPKPEPKTPTQTKSDKKDAIAWAHELINEIPERHRRALLDTRNVVHEELGRENVYAPVDSTKLLRATASLLAHLLENSPVKPEMAKKWVDNINYQDIPPAEIRKVKDALSDFFTLTGGMGIKSLATVAKNHPRAYATEPKSTRGGSINIGEYDPDDLLRVILHEGGHHEEFVDPIASQENLAFLQRRATGSLQPYNTISIGHSDSNPAYPDHFIDSYVGKVYDSNNMMNLPHKPFKPDRTEVTSMGLERFDHAISLANLAYKDPEHFHLILGKIARQRAKIREQKL